MIRQMVRYACYAFGVLYICIIPLALRWLRPRPIHRKKSCSEHHHYAKEVPTAWHRLYASLVSITHKPISLKHDAAYMMTTLYDIVVYSLSLFVPNFVLKLFHRNARPVGCPDELARVGAWIRLNEVECLGGK